MARRELERKSEARVEEMRQELEGERAKQRAAVAVVLKRYRCAQASCAEVEQAHDHLCSRSESLTKESSEARVAMRRARDRRQKQQQAERGKVPHVAGDPPGPRVESQERSRAEPKTPTPAAARAVAAGGTGHTPSRYVPSVLEMRQRIDPEGHAELHGFYLQVFPLLKGTNLEVFRRSRQRFETRQLLLSSDLQRLELWPPAAPVAASPSAAEAAPSSRGRPRLAEAFLRVEGLARVHVPKATLVAVQRAILSATGASEGSASATSSSARGRDGAQVDALGTGVLSADVARAMESWSRDAGMGTPQAPEGGGPEGGAYGSPRNAGAAGAGSGALRASPGSGGRPAFPFDLVMSCSDTWRFMTADVHTFHLATQAIGALLTCQASLPSYAIALSLGGGSHQQQA